MSDRRRCALLGFGHIAATTHLPALAACGITPVAILETNPERQALARQMLPQASVYGALQPLLAQTAPELVDVCTPPHLHAAQVQQALRAGAHVLCEKPLVTELQQLHALVQQARAAGRVLGCVHNWTAAPIVRAVGRLIAEGSLGALQHIDARTARTQPAAAAGAAHSWRGDPQLAGGGIVFDHGWHGMSILLRWAGGRPTQVDAQLATRRHHHLAVEDSCEARIKFAGGV
ncbi:MAG: Gfo/Idh/MocA family oxidoreductase, partial [Deltaproteobacteria bacterium]